MPFRRCCAYLTIIWLIGMLTSSLVTIFSCTIALKYTNRKLLESMTFLCASVPYILTLAALLCMYVALKTHGKRRFSGGQMPSVYVTQVEKDNARITRTIAFVVIGYSVTCLPYMVILGQQLAGTLHNIPGRPQCKTWQATMMLASGIIDVVVYSGTDRRFRRYVWRHIFFRCLRGLIDKASDSQSDDPGSIPASVG